jgi:hypothetical protein
MVSQGESGRWHNQLKEDQLKEDQLKEEERATLIFPRDGCLQRADQVVVHHREDPRRGMYGKLQNLMMFPPPLGSRSQHLPVGVYRLRSDMPFSRAVQRCALGRHGNSHGLRTSLRRVLVPPGRPTLACNGSVFRRKRATCGRRSPCWKAGNLVGRSAARSPRPHNIVSEKRELPGSIRFWAAPGMLK